MVSPSATSPALSTISDNGYFFRTAPSDARQGQLLAEITLSRGIKSVAVTYVNSDYGKGFCNEINLKKLISLSKKNKIPILIDPRKNLVNSSTKYPSFGIKLDPNFNLTEKLEKLLI